MGVVPLRGLPGRYRPGSPPPPPVRRPARDPRGREPPDTEESPISGPALALLLFSFVLQFAAVVCMVLGFLWNRRRKRLVRSERALALDAPVGAEQSRVSLYLRHGATAPDPELAHLTVRVAELKRRRLENPWPHAGACLFLLGSSLAVIVRSVDGGFVGLLCFGIAGSALAVCAPLLRRLMLARADLALAANRELAERYEVPEEGPPPPPRER